MEHRKDWGESVLPILPGRRSSYVRPRARVEEFCT